MVRIEDNQLLQGLPLAQRRLLAERLPVRTHAAGDEIVAEGDVADSVGLICEGRLLVWRSRGEARIELAVLEPGDWYGSSCFSTGVRSASLTAQSPATIAVMSVDSAWEMLDADPGIDPLERFLLNVTWAQSQHLSQQREALLDAAHAQIRAGNAVAILISLVAGYAYFLSAFPGAVGRSMELMSLTIAALAALGAALFLRSARLPLSVAGLTLAGLRPALAAAVGWSVVVCAVLTGLKALNPHWSGVPLLMALPMSAETVGWLLVYLVSAAVQEFAARSFLHTVFDQLFEGPLRDVRAVVMSNLVFSVFHLHYSPKFAAMTFLIGLVYGAFWVRHRSLLAVSVFHWITGVWVLDVLGLLQLPGLGG